MIFQKSASQLTFFSSSFILEKPKIQIEFLKYIWSVFHCPKHGGSTIFFVLNVFICQKISFFLRIYGTLGGMTQFTWKLSWPPPSMPSLLHPNATFFNICLYGNSNPFDPPWSEITMTLQLNFMLLQITQRNVI